MPSPDGATVPSAEAAIEKAGIVDDAASPEPQAPSLSTRRLGLTLGAIVALGPFAIDVYLPSFKALGSDLHASPGAVQETMAVYFLGMAVGQLFYGPLSDRFGRRRPLAFGLGLFIIASIGCALSTTILTLTLCRLAQALGGAAQQVTTQAVARDHFSGRDLIRVNGALMTISGLAPIIAPVIGGQLVTHFGWRSVFWVLAGAGAFCIVWTAVTLPESLPAHRRRPAQLARVLSTYAMLLRDHRFAPHAMVACLMGAGFSTYLAGSPYIFMGLYGLRPDQFAMLFAVNSVGLMIAAQLSVRVAFRFNPARVLSAMLLLNAIVGVALITLAATRWEGLLGLCVPLFVYISSRGAINPLNNALAMEHQGANAGSAAAAMGVMQLISGAIMNTVLGLFADGTAVPWTVILALCGLGSLLVRIFWGERQPGFSG